MPTTTNYGWTTPADTDLVKDGASAIRTLGTAIDTTVFNNASAGIAKTIVDAKGDIIAATAADTVSRLAVGANDTVLTADSSTATGLKWATPSSGGMTLISEQVASGVSSLSFGSIPATYKQLILIWHGVYQSDNSAFSVRFNNDSTTSYSILGHIIDNYTNASVSGNLTHIGAQDPYSFGFNSTSTTDYSYMSKGELLLDNYNSTSKFKFFRYHTSTFYAGGGNDHADIDGTYKSTSAITSLDIVRISGSGTFSNATNTSIRLYGVS